MAIAKNEEVEVPIIMNEKVINQDESHNEPHRSDSTIVIYQNGNTFYFGESLAGCATTLLLNNVVVYSNYVSPSTRRYSRQILNCSSWFHWRNVLSYIEEKQTIIWKKIRFTKKM